MIISIIQVSARSITWGKNDFWRLNASHIDASLLGKGVIA